MINNQYKTLKLNNIKNNHCSEYRINEPILQKTLLKLIPPNPSLSCSKNIELNNLLSESIMHFILKGYDVDLGFMKFSSYIEGTFKSPEDEFDPKRHKFGIKITMRNGLKLKKEIKLENIID